jgi:predicted acyltransferase
MIAAVRDEGSPSTSAQGEAEAAFAPTMVAERPAAAGERFVALDALRGLTIAGMILVNNPGSGAHVYAPLEHAPWDGWTPTDLIFPSFLFIVGVSLVFSFAKRRARGDGRGALLAHALRRSLSIYAVSFFLLGSFIPNFLHGRWPSFETIRILGVLPRIALCYLLAAPLVLYTRPRAWGYTVLGLLVGYFALMKLVPVPGHGAGLLDSKEWNLEAYVDRLVLGKHLWRGSKLWDPEGLLSTLGALATTLLGALTGEYLRPRPDSRESRSARDKTVALFAAGAVLLVAGMAWNRVFPINKNLWSSSYVLFTAGFSLELLAFLYYVVDQRGHRRVAEPFVMFGSNPLAVYVLSSFTAILLSTIDVQLADGTTGKVWTWLYRALFVPWAGELNGSLAFAIAFVLVWLGVATLLYRRRIFIRL